MVLKEELNTISTSIISDSTHTHNKMYGSYGSYSSMGSLSQPLDISGSGSYLSRPAPSTSSYYHQSSCAYPSWPQRSSLDSPDFEERASSYLSDDDLLYESDLVSSPASATMEVGSVSSSSSSSSGAPAAPNHGNFLGLNPPPAEDDVLALQQQQMALQREAVRMLVAERERRRQAFKKSRARTSYNKKSAKGKKADMAPITESGE